MSSEFGKVLRISVYGESHGPSVGAEAEGFPAGEEIDTSELASFTARRRPGRSPLVSQRTEDDETVILSGVSDGRTDGSPLRVMIKNTGASSADYAGLEYRPRPGHADYTAYVKYGGSADMRGGGRFSGRLTAPLCALGGIALQMLRRRGIYVGAHLSSVGHVSDDPFPLLPSPELFGRIAGADLPVIDPDAGRQMAEEIMNAAAGNIFRAAVF